ncbi:hypothetical protein FACS1894199_11560 [Bacteroidia bacterium]|nr:hypothetical protein FACS1894199_11560 [Bacteroidia bacterium]
MERESVPMDMVHISIPVRDISLLPAGASYSEKTGRAGVKFRVVNDTVLIEATCDSLARVIQMYEMKLSRASNETTTRQIVTESKASFFTLLKWGIIGALIGSVITILIYLRIKI